MKCPISGKECTFDKNVHLTQIINGEKSEVDVCGQCAHTGLFDSGFIGILLNNDLIKTVDKNECPQCKSTLTSIKQQGKVGCPMCYMTFESYFDSLLEQVHGKKTHQGKKPNKQHNSIKDLKNKLQEAIKNEKYEDAAVLRDAINRLEENSHQQTQNPKTSSS